MLRALFDRIADSFRAMYWNVAEVFSALNPFPALGSLFREAWDILYVLRRGIENAVRFLLSLPRIVGQFLYRVGRFLVLLPFEAAAMFGIGKSRMGLKERLTAPISAVGETIGGISGTVSELQPGRVGERIREETKDVSFALLVGIRNAIGTIVWAPFAFLYFLYDLLRGIATLPARLKDAIVNRSKKQLAWAGLFIVFCSGSLFLVWNVWTSHGARNNKIAKLWQEVDIQLRSVAPDKALAALEQLKTLLPDDTVVEKRLKQLRSGEPVPDDQPIMRMYMRKELSEGKVAKAAAKAQAIVAVEPSDWEGNLVLAHRALLENDKVVAAKHISRMSDPEKVSMGIGPGAMVYATKVLREVGDRAMLKKLQDYYIYRLLPAVNSYEVEKWPTAQKLQMIDGYLISLEQLDSRTGLATYWVPIQRMCRWVMEDPALDMESLQRLGMAEEAQFNALQAFKARKLIGESECAELSREVETRLSVIWDQVLKRDPKNVRAYTAKSLARYRANDVDGAVALLTKGIEACGPAIELVSAKSQLLRISDPAAGYQFARSSAQSDPKSVPLLAILAETSIKNGRLDEALAACQQAIALQKDLEWANRLMGQICLEMNRPTEAIIAYRRIPKVVVNEPKAANEYVRALSGLQLFDDAEKFVSEITIDSDERAQVVAECCNAFIRAGRSDLALKHVRRLLEKRPAHLAGRLIYADLLRMKAESGQDWDLDLARQAIDEYRTILLRDPKNLAVVNNVAWLELKALKQPQLAWQTAEPLRTNEEGTAISPEMLETLGAIYLANDQPEKARSALNRAVARGTPRASFFMNLSDVYLRLKMRPQAELYFSRAKQFPTTPLESREMTDLAIRIRGTQ